MKIGYFKIKGIIEPIRMINHTHNLNLDFVNYDLDWFN